MLGQSPLSRLNDGTQAWAAAVCGTHRRPKPINVAPGPTSRKTAGSRVAASMAVRPVSGLSLSAGGEYDLSYQAWGSADGAVRWSSRLVDVTLGARRYRPFFPLWTIWGAFSPIGHDGGYAALRVSPFPGVQLREVNYWNKNKGLCCGAGGAQMFMEEQGEKRVNVKRTLQLLETGAQTVASGCPFCMTMLTDGLKAHEKEDSVQARDVAELLAESVAVEDGVKAEAAE